jgi:hypothetical protein
MPSEPEMNAHSPHPVSRFAQPRARASARHLALAAILLALAGCSDTREEAPAAEAMPDEVIQPASTSYPDTDDDDDEATRDADTPTEPPQFMGSPCTDDCSGHEAGYQWAEENGIDDPDDCSGNSDSFVEGCETYAEEQ